MKTSSLVKHRARSAAFKRLSDLLLPMLLAWPPQAGADSARNPADGTEITVLDVSNAVYEPLKGSPARPNEEAACKAWSLDKAQIARFFRLSKPLREGELHDYYWLPCSIKGRLQVNGRAGAFEINAAGTSIWRDGAEVVQLGCALAACEPLVILTRDATAR